MREIIKKKQISAILKKKKKAKAGLGDSEGVM